MIRVKPLRPWIAALLVVNALLLVAAVAMGLWFLVAVAICNAVALLLVNPSAVARAQENQRKIERWGRADR